MTPAADYSDATFRKMHTNQAQMLRLSLQRQNSPKQKSSDTNKKMENQRVLRKLQQFFTERLSEESDSGNAEQRTRLAAAALLVEVARADYEDDPEELTAVCAALRETLNVSEEDIKSLVDLANQEVESATSSYEFTRLIIDNFSPEQRIELIEAMWQVAYADGNLDRYEEHYIRRIAELLYVPHSQFIRTKQNVVQKSSSPKSSSGSSPVTRNLRR